jgi:hypothetical protein
MKLTRFESTWAAASLVAIFPGSDEAGLAGIETMNVTGFLDELVPEMPLHAALGLRLAIWLLALAPLFVIGKLTTLARLGQLDREAVVAKLVASEWYAVRSLVMILKTFGAMLYAGDDRVRTRLLARPHGERLLSLRTKSMHAA